MRRYAIVAGPRIFVAGERVAWCAGVISCADRSSILGLTVRRVRSGKPRISRARRRRVPSVSIDLCVAAGGGCARVDRPRGWGMQV